MIALRCTRKILDRLGVEPVEPPGSPTNVLGDWYVNLLRVGAEQIVLASRERLLLSVVLPARDLRQTLISGLCDATFRRLQELGIDRDRVKREVAAMQPAVYARTASRSVLGGMNDVARELRHWRRAGRELPGSCEIWPRCRCSCRGAGTAKVCSAAGRPCSSSPAVPPRLPLAGSEPFNQPEDAARPG